MLFIEIIAVCPENHTKPLNTSVYKNTDLLKAKCTWYMYAPLYFEYSKPTKELIIAYRMRKRFNLTSQVI
jgi:hypothetical protein